MARTDELEPDEVEESAPKSKPKKGRARVEHTIKTTFVEEPRIKDVLNPATTLKPAVATLEEIPEAEIDDAPEAPPRLADKVQRFLSAVEDEEEEFELLVWRLPLFNANGRTDTRSGRIFVGKFPFDPDTYETEIKMRYARPGMVNIFHSELRQNGAPVRSLPVLHVELEQDTEAAASVQSALPVAANPALPLPPAAAGIETIENQLAQFDRFLSLAQKINKLTNPAPQAIANPAPAAVETSEDFALFKLLMSSDTVAEKIKDTALGKLFNGEAKPSKAHEPSGMELLALGLQQGPQIVAEIFKGIAQLRTQSTAFAPAPTLAALAQPAAPPAPAVPVADPQAEYSALFAGLFQRLQTNAPAQEAAAQVQAFVLRWPQYEPHVMAFLQSGPDAMLNIIRQIPEAAPAAELPHARQWLADLFGEFFEESEEGNDAGNGSPEHTAAPSQRN